jgi:hypothetical protein
VSKRLILLLLMAGLSSCNAYAEDKNVLAIHGFDKMSCSDWTASHDDDATRAMYVAWIRGIVTGYNYANPDNQVALGHMPGDFTLGLFVDAYCHEHRSQSFAGAAFDLIVQKRGSAELAVINDLSEPTDTGKSAKTSKTAKPSATPANDDDYNAWLKRQSDDMRSLDPKLLRNIYEKETAPKTDPITSQ